MAKKVKKALSIVSIIITIVASLAFLFEVEFFKECVKLSVDDSNDVVSIAVSLLFFGIGSVVSSILSIISIVLSSIKIKDSKLISILLISINSLYLIASIVFAIIESNI